MATHISFPRLSTQAILIKWFLNEYNDARGICPLCKKEMDIKYGQVLKYPEDKDCVVISKKLFWPLNQANKPKNLELMCMECWKSKEEKVL